MKSSKIIILVALLALTLSALLGWYVYQNAHLFLSKDEPVSQQNQDDRYDWSIPPAERIPEPSNNVLFLTLQNSSKNSVFNAPIIFFHRGNFDLATKGDKFVSPLARMFDFPIVDAYIYDMLLRMRYKGLIFDFDVVQSLDSDNPLYSVSFGPFTAPEDMYVSVFAVDSDMNDGYAYIDSVKIYDASTNTMVVPASAVVTAKNYDAGLEKNSKRSGFAAGKYDPSKKEGNIGNGVKTDGVIGDHVDMKEDSLRLILRTQTVSELERQSTNAEAALRESQQSSNTN